VVKNRKLGSPQEGTAWIWPYQTELAEPIGISVLLSCCWVRCGGLALLGLRRGIARGLVCLAASALAI